MAKDREYNKGGKSKPDAGLVLVQARVAAQRSSRHAEPDPIKPDAHHQAILDRAQAARDKAAKANAERDAAAAKAATTSSGS